MHKLLHTKDGLILSTIQVISEQGLQGLTTREVAKRQGISESTIFKHYKSKNELIHAVLDHFSQYDQVITETLALKKLQPLEAITYFVDAYVTYYENYPEITAITLSYEGLMREPELSEVVKGIFTRRYAAIQSLIEKAQSRKAIPEYIDPKSLADLIIGLEAAVVLRWRLENYNFPLKKQTMMALRTLLEGFKLKNEID